MLLVSEPEILSEEFGEAKKWWEQSGSFFIEYYLHFSQEMAIFLDPSERQQLAQNYDTNEEFMEQKGLNNLKEELENLMQAIDDAYSVNYWAGVYNLTINLASFFSIGSYWKEWHQRHELALEAAYKAGDKLAEAWICNNLGAVYRLFGRRDKAIEMCGRSQYLFQELGQQGRKGEATALNTLGNVYRAKGWWTEAIKAFEKSISIFRELQDPFGEAKALDGLGHAYALQNSLELAEEILKESLRIKQEVGASLFEVSKTYNNLGKVYAKLLRLSEAEELFRKSLSIKREIGDRQGEGVSLHELGEIYRLQSCWEQAQKMYANSIEVKEQIADYNGQGLTLIAISNLHLNRDDQEEAIEARKQALATLHRDSPSYKQVAEWLQSIS
ncbi:MAG: tetratricopeptide repeat protein [Symploca sp. SIO1B1]|nr:tetratricopeptide repeat protein [Symploca sp. SIO1B1]